MYKLLGRSIFESKEHCRNADDPISFKIDGKLTSLNETQPSKALLPILVTEAGIKTLVSEEHCSKRPEFISSTFA